MQNSYSTIFFCYKVKAQQTQVKPKFEQMLLDKNRSFSLGVLLWLGKHSDSMKYNLHYMTGMEWIHLAVVCFLAHLNLCMLMFLPYARCKSSYSGISTRFLRNIRSLGSLIEKTAASALTQMLSFSDYASEKWWHQSDTNKIWSSPFFDWSQKDELCDGLGKPLLEVIFSLIVDVRSKTDTRVRTLRWHVFLL